MVSSFFKKIWRIFSGLMRVLQVLIFFAFIFIFVMIFRDRSDGTFGVPESAALVLAPTGMLVEQVEGEPLEMALLQMQGAMEPQTVVRDVVESLRLAADDDRIKLVVLLPQFLQGGGLSKQQAIARALVEFRESGKPVIAMADNYSQPQYYLASHADEIYMHDFGLVLIEGFGYFKTYFAEAIEKLRVDVNVFRVGEFKSFVEPYLRNDMSEEDKAASERWLNALWDIYQRDVTSARDMPENALERYITGLAGLLENADGDAAKVALNTGLVDGLMSRQEFRDYIIEKVGRDDEYSDDFQSIDYRTYLSATAMIGAPTETGSNVGIIVASGNIVDGEASPGAIGSTTLSRLIRQAGRDESVAAVVLLVDSPGGSMFASEVVLDQLEELQKQGKPLVASMGSIAASGGYYISMSADEIWASETTISGSIGVGAIFPTFQRTLSGVGVTIDGFGTTPLAGQFSGVQALGKEAERLLNISVKSAYDVFISKVAENRGMNQKQVDEIARGRVWIGPDAEEIGLVDNIGTLEDAVASAAALADLGPDQYGTKYISRELSFSEQILLQYARLLGGLFGWANGLDSNGVLKRLVKEFEEPVEFLDVWNDPKGLYLHCFCEYR